MTVPNIDYTRYRSTTYNKRVRFLVLHYTAVDFKTSVELLTSKSSIHYLVPRLDDPTYKEAGFTTLKVFNLVDENDRAWHAGVSTWAGRSNLNDTSIGIEIVNLASEKNGVFTFPAYEDDQVDALIKLTTNILERYPDISPRNVVAHSDIAPGRKSDPGPAFPWQRLAEAGIGAWYDDTIREHFVGEFQSQGLPAQADLAAAFKKYGYGIANAPTDAEFKDVTRAFQMHFRPSNYTGEMDVETAAILYALNEKYSQA